MRRSVATLEKSLSCLQMSPSKPPSDYSEALEIVRNSEPGQAPPEAKRMTDAAIVQLWNRLRAKPDTYIMSDKEFKLFNYYRHAYQSGADGEIGRNAASRYWNHSSRFNGH